LVSGCGQDREEAKDHPHGRSAVSLKKKENGWAEKEEKRKGRKKERKKAGRKGAATRLCAWAEGGRRKKGRRGGIWASREAASAGLLYVYQC